jgi:hypothetical protein
LLPSSLPKMRYTILPAERFLRMPIHPGPAKDLTYQDVAILKLRQNVTNASLLLFSILTIVMPIRLKYAPFFSTTIFPLFGLYCCKALFLLLFYISNFFFSSAPSFRALSDCSIRYSADMRGILLHPPLQILFYQNPSTSTSTVRICPCPSPM